MELKDPVDCGWEEMDWEYNWNQGCYSCIWDLDSE